MLDTQTKKRIDDCRDILVGKLPDPKAQIEQITIGLIYKFMYDMDKEAVELGGKVKFFADYKVPDPEFPKDRKKDKIVEFSKYSWERLFDSKVTASEMLTLYSEAILSMDKNPNVPQLFRDIFKNAYLPYRDPETLKMFLKTIGEFEYTHSEKLGDAFEYLLSVMGSQGDAGQFRTPRHIIDFLVSAIDPDKADSIADPACGTAGFLISAYKHILLKHTKANQEGLNIYQYNKHGDQKPFNNLGDLLTPDDRKKLIQNFVGYDISPDMVRLSLVNLYLHGFAHPHIYEYDTLSSEDRWNESFDVILANPPFMTPKGGIRPHKKFGVQANKSEVLFTDYIAEHLNNKGRSGIVVPNGIVATSQTAYKQLRKMLVKDSLIAVISLPAGVFQPYSGVKTSILILDRALAKKSKHILFLKIENDGYDLGAQRREIEKNDLPMALQTLKAYKDHLVMLSAVEPDKDFNELPAMATFVEKEIVLGNKDVVLSAERYFVTEAVNTDYEIVKLEDVCDFIDYRGKTPTKTESGVRLITAKNVKFGYLSREPLEYIAEEDYVSWMTRGIPTKGDVLITTEAPLGNVAQIDTDDKIALAQRIITLIPKSKNLDKTFLKNALLSDQVQFELNGFATGSTVLGIKSSSLKEISIPLPPLEMQQQIVAEIEGYQKIIDGAKQVVNNYKPSIRVKEEWEMVELGEVAKLVGGSTPSKENESYWKNGNVDWITCSDFSTNPMFIENSIRKITEKAVKENSTSVVPKDTLVLVTRVSLGKMAFVRKPTALNQDLTGLIFDDDKINKRYAYFLILSMTDKIASDGHGATVKGVTRDYVKEIKIPLPELSEQLEIVKVIEEELQLVNTNKRLIEIFEQKIKDKIGEVWGVKEEVGMAMAAEPVVEYKSIKKRTN